MDVLNNINTIVSLIAGLIAIGTAVASVLSKRKSVQHTLENPSTPAQVRLYLEEQWNGPALWTKIVTGVIKAGLAAVFSTIVVTFVINFFLAFQTFLQDMNAFSRASSYSQAQNIFSQMLSVMGQIFMFSNPVSLTIGIIVGLLFGILAALSTGNRHMPARVYRIYSSPPYGPS
jgi:vacuolar-type H+-ATPase subunit I/STV1